MKYYVKTKHQDGNDYICVETTNIGAALKYAADAADATLNKEIALIVNNEHDDEICIVFNGLLYQEQDFNEVRQYAEELEGGAE